MALDGEQIRDDLFRKLDLEDPTKAPSYIREDVAIAMSWAYQRIWSAPWDFFRKTTKTFPTVGGTQSYLLDQEITEILGPVSIQGNAHLHPIEKKSDFDHWGTLFQGSTSLIPSNGTPEGFHVFRETQPSGDNVIVRMLLAPTPDAVYTIAFEAATEAPTVSPADLCNDPGITIQIPHAYVESIFLPLARLGITRSHYYNAIDKLQMFQTDAALALQTLQFADPQIKEIVGATPIPT